VYVVLCRIKYNSNAGSAFIFVASLQKATNTLAIGVSGGSTFTMTIGITPSNRFIRLVTVISVYLLACVIVTGFEIPIISKSDKVISFCLKWRPHGCSSSFNRQLNRSTTNKRPGILKSQYIPMDGDKSKDASNASKLPNAKARRPTSDNDIESVLEFVIPTITPIIAFLSYEPIARGFSFVTDLLSANDWVAVDGGTLQAKVITPAINGIIVPAVALLYATLTSTTITTLRQRQVDIRNSINLEAGELRNLGHKVFMYPKGPTRDFCRSYLLQYTSRLLQECQPHVSSASDVIDPRRGMDTELNGFLIQVHQGYDDPIPVHLASESFSSVTRLRTYRINRITALQSTYPALHYVTLVILALAECIVFLMETNQDVIFFLSAFQLKVLWAIIVGTFTACFAVFYDLGAPFTGTYKISASVEQLYVIREALKASAILDQEETKADSLSLTLGEEPKAESNSDSLFHTAAENINTPPLNFKVDGDHQEPVDSARIMNGANIIDNASYADDIFMPPVSPVVSQSQDNTTAQI
jgi:hypothetical protein